MGGYLCGPKVYQYNKLTFEVSACSGPWPLKKDGSPKAKASAQFYKWYHDFFSKLSKEDQESYRIGGGCIKF